MTASFHNPGLIDIRAITTMGVSSKDTETPIGYFGTGLKYAIAIVLRIGGGITIWRGLEPFHFGTEKCRIRNDDFHVVTMNKHELGFTTLLGQKWTAWQAFRELYCNALDEGGSLAGGKLTPAEGTTTVTVYGCPEFDELYRQRSTIFLESSPFIKSEECEVHHGSSAWYYYRKIRSDEMRRPWNYTYNLTAQIDLTEDRSIKHIYQPLRYISNLVLTCEDKGFIYEWLTQPETSSEYHADLGGATKAPSETFLDVVSDLRNAADTDFNPTALGVLRNYRPKKIDFTRKVTLTKVEQAQLDKAIKFLQRLNHDVSVWPIVVVENLESGTLALAVDGTIAISRRAFMMGGTKMIAATLLEEHLHLQLKLLDCTCEMQNYLFERIVSLGEELVGEPL